MKIRVFDFGAAVFYAPTDDARYITNEQSWFVRDNNLIIIMDKDMPVHLELDGCVLTLYRHRHFLFFNTIPDGIYNVAFGSANGTYLFGRMKVYFRPYRGYYDVFVHYAKPSIDWDKFRALFSLDEKRIRPM